MVEAPSVGPPSARPRSNLPEERFWKRYSPHGELPLSGAGSFALHALGVGLLVLLGFLSVWFTRPSRTLPVEAVQVAGGGGGLRNGVEGSQGPGSRDEVVADQQSRPAGDQNVPTPPELARPQKRPPASQFKEGARPIQVSPEAREAFDRLRGAAQSQRKDGPPAGPGRGGPGPGGDGPGPGRGGPRSPKIERMLRWSMLFNTQTGADYVRQLRGLGAILAIPVKEGERPEYRLVRNLSQRPAQLLEEDLSKINRIYWIDDKPRSVQEVMKTLGLQLQPRHFVAFMPEELEQKLLRLEKAHAGLEEDQIFETKFRVVERGGRFEPEVIEQTPKKR
jgi:hypothetical protein